MHRLPPADEDPQALPWYPIIRRALALQVLELEEWIQQELHYLEELCMCDCADCIERREAIAPLYPRPVELHEWRKKRA
jgi:hypothetical protein